MKDVEKVSKELRKIEFGKSYYLGIIEVLDLCIEKMRMCKSLGEFQAYHKLFIDTYSLYCKEGLK